MTVCLCLTVSEVPDWGCDLSGQSRWQQSTVRHPRLASLSCFYSQLMRRCRRVAKRLQTKFVVLNFRIIVYCCYCCWCLIIVPCFIRVWLLSALALLPGLDYVSHEDILPYNSTEQVPIQHELFERFLMYNPTKCTNPSSIETSVSISAFQRLWAHFYFLHF